MKNIDKEKLNLPNPNPMFVVELEKILNYLTSNNDKYLMVDRVHLSDEGNEALAKMLFDSIE